MKRKSRGFTIIELVVVIGIIAGLLLLIFPALQGVLKRANLVDCMDNMKRLSTAAQLYAADHNGELPDVAPDASTSCGDLANSDYIDDEDTYICPGDDRSGDEFGPFKTSYTACLFTPAFLSFRTGSVRTILYIESDSAGVASRDEIDLSDCSARHGGITVISFADGHVTAFNENKLAAFAETVTPTISGGGPTTIASTEPGEPAPTVTPFSAGGGSDAAYRVQGSDDDEWPEIEDNTGAAGSGYGDEGETAYTGDGIDEIMAEQDKGEVPTVEAQATDGGGRRRVESESEEPQINTGGRRRAD